MSEMILCCCKIGLFPSLDVDWTVSFRTRTRGSEPRVRTDMQFIRDSNTPKNEKGLRIREFRPIAISGKRVMYIRDWS